jgi:hypothetical protein
LRLVPSQPCPPSLVMYIPDHLTRLSRCIPNRPALIMLGRVDGAQRGARRAEPRPRGAWPRYSPLSSRNSSRCPDCALVTVRLVRMLGSVFLLRCDFLLTSRSGTVDRPNSGVLNTHSRPSRHLSRGCFESDRARLPTPLVRSNFGRSSTTLREVMLGRSSDSAHESAAHRRSVCD